MPVYSACLVFLPRGVVLLLDFWILVVLVPFGIEPWSGFSSLLDFLILLRLKKIAPLVQILQNFTKRTQSFKYETNSYASKVNTKNSHVLQLQVSPCYLQLLVSLQLKTDQIQVSCKAATLQVSQLFSGLYKTHAPICVHSTPLYTYLSAYAIFFYSFNWSASIDRPVNIFILFFFSKIKKGHEEEKSHRKCVVLPLEEETNNTSSQPMWQSLLYLQATVLFLLFFFSFLVKSKQLSIFFQSCFKFFFYFLKDNE